MKTMLSEAAPTTRQEEILDRALELVRETGLAGITMKKIAERVGFTEPAVYRHFPTKQALLVGLAGRVGQMLLGPIREIAARADLTTTEKLERTVAHHVGLVLDTDGFPILLFAEASASGDEALIARMGEVARELRGALLKLVGELPSAPGGPPQAALALPLLGIGASLAIQRRLVPEARLEKEQVMAMVPLMVRRIVGAEVAGSTAEGAA
jgi:AcrR family transcriptional regulator